MKVFFFFLLSLFIHTLEHPLGFASNTHSTICFNSLNACFDTLKSMDERKNIFQTEYQRLSTLPIENDTVLFSKIIIGIYNAKYFPSAETITLCKELKKNIDKKIKNKSTNSLLQLGYGVMQVEGSSLSFYQRMVAQIFYEELPDGFSMDEGLLYLLQAKLTIPIFHPLLSYYLSEAYISLYNITHALLHLQKIIKDTPSNNFDAFFQRESTRLYQLKKAVK